MNLDQSTGLANADDPKSERHHLYVTIAIAAFLCVAVVSRLSFLGEPFKNDAGIYIYWGKSTWTGGWPYVAFWDTKLPSVPLMMSALYAVLRSCWPAYVVLDMLLGIGAAVIGAVALRQYVGRETFVPALIFGVTALNLSRLTITGFQLETVQVFFEIAAAAFVLRSLARQSTLAAWCAGILSGMAAMPKPTGLSVAAAAGCVYLLLLFQPNHRRKAILQILALIGGACIPIAAVTIWVVLSPWRGSIPEVLRQISLYGSGTPWRTVLQPKTVIFFAMPVAPIAIRWIYYFIRRRLARNLQRRPVPLNNNYVYMVFILSWLAIDCAGLILQRRLYGYHFLVLMGPAMFLFAIWPRRGELIPVVIALVPLAVISLIFSVPGYKQLLHGNGAMMPVSRYVRAHTVPADSVWADPSPRLLLETGRQTGSRLSMTFYFVNYDKAPKYFSNELIQDFQQRRPKYIIMKSGWDSQTRQMATETPELQSQPKRKAAYIHARNLVLQYIMSHYHLETSIGSTQVYRRNQGA